MFKVFLTKTLLLRFYRASKKYFIVILFFLAVVDIISNVSISKEQDINKVVVQQLNETINWDDPRFYKEAKANLARAKEIKKDAKRRKALKNAGLSNEEIKRIMREEKQNSVNNIQATKQKKQNTSKAQNIEEEEDEDDDDIINVKANGDIAKYNKSFDFFENNNKQNQKLVYDSGVENNDVKKSNYQNQAPITNNYNTYNTYNTYNNREEDDYKNIVPEIPALPSGKYVSQPTEEDFAIQSLAKKAGNNVNNSQNFKTFTKELARVANQPATIRKTNREILEEAEMIARKQQIEQQLNEYYKQKQLESDYGYNDNDYYSYNYNTSNGLKSGKKGKKKVSIGQQYASAVNKYNNKTQAKKVYATNKQNGNLYAVSSKSNKNSKSNNRQDNNKMYASVGASDRFYASALPSIGGSPLSKQSGKTSSKKAKSPLNQKEAEQKQSDNRELGDIEYTDDNTSVVGRVYMTEEQIKAKNVGAPTPVLRRNTDRRIQIMPPNISQVGSYDKNNKHLQRVAFEENIINDVFDHLLDSNSIEIVRALINKVGKTDIVDAYGNSLLMHAVALKHQSLIAMLLAEGADPNLVNNEGFSSLHLASSNGDNISLYHLLMAGGDPNKRDQDGNTALMYAVMMCNLSSIKLMVSLGGDITARNGMTNKSVVDYAEQNNNVEVRNFLLNKNNSTFRKRQAKDLV